MSRKLKNIRWRRGKPQAYTEVGGKPQYKTFDRNTPIADIRAWIEDASKNAAPATALDGSFAADIEAYKKRIAALPTYKQKAAHLALWAHALGGDRPRRTITDGEIDAVMQHWLTTPTKPQAGKRGRPSGEHGLDLETVRKRRTSLNSLFSKLDGKAAENPVRAAVLRKPANAEVRGTDYTTIARIIAAMPTFKDTPKGSPQKVNETKLRVAVLAYTGLPPGILATMKAADVNLKAGTFRVDERLKGGGVEARTLQLTPQGADAFAALIAAGAMRKFAPGPVNVSFKRACRRIDVSGLTVYDLRHSFGAQMYRVSKDPKAVARFMLHAEGSSMTSRYTKAADADVDRAAAEAFGASLPRTGSESVRLEDVKSQKNVRRDKVLEARQRRRA